MKLNFCQLWQQHQNGIGRVVRSYEANKDEQQELMQEIGVAIWRALPSCKDADKVKSFIYRIAHNQAVDHISRQVKRPKTTELDVELLSTSEIEQLNQGQQSSQYSQQQQKLIAAMRVLPLQQKQVMCLLLEGFSYQQIADITGVSATNVGVLINRGKTKLQGVLNEQ